MWPSVDQNKIGGFIFIGIMSLGSPCFHLENMNYLMIVTHQDYEGFKDEELDVLERRSGWGSLYMSDPQVLCMDSSDPQNPPRYIGRQNCEPLITQEFFSLRHNWQQLLDGKKTYLRPPKNNRVAKDNYASL